MNKQPHPSDLPVGTVVHIKRSDGCQIVDVIKIGSRYNTGLARTSYGFTTSYGIVLHWDAFSRTYTTNCGYNSPTAREWRNKTAEVTVLSSPKQEAELLKEFTNAPLEIRKLREKIYDRNI